MVKTFKNLLQKSGRLVAESLHKSSGTGGLPKLLKWWLYVDVFTFLRQGQICFPMHLYGPHTFNSLGKMLRISNDFSSEAAGPVLLKFQVEPLGTGERQIAKMTAVRWPRWPPWYGKNLYKSSSLEPRIPWGWIIAQKVYQSCCNDDRTLTFDLFTARSSLLDYAFVWAP